MTIAQALKEKNKKAANLGKLWQKMYSYNSVPVGSDQPYNLDEIWDDIQNESVALIQLKTKIHEASARVREEIFALSELKSQVNQLKSLNTAKGKQHSRYESTPIEINAHFDVKWKDSQIELLEAKIEYIQEKLDKFNHTTEI